MICHRLIRIQHAVLTALVSTPTQLKHRFTLSSVLSLFLPLRAKGGGGDEGHGPGVQQRSHPIQQLCQLRRGRYRTAGVPDRHRLEPVTLPTFHTVFKDNKWPTHLQPLCLLLPQSCRPCGSLQESVARPSSRTCASLRRSLSTWRARWSMSPSGTRSSSWGHPCKTTEPTDPHLMVSEVLIGPLGSWKLEPRLQARSKL